MSVTTLPFFAVLVLCTSIQLTAAFVPNNAKVSSRLSVSIQAATGWFPIEPVSTVSEGTTEEKIETESISLSVDQLKAQILQLGATLDRGQAYNPTAGEYYSSTMKIAKEKVEELVSRAESGNVPKTLEEMEGEWELVFTSVPHGIFRSSPFFLAIQEAFEYAEDKGK